MKKNVSFLVSLVILLLGILPIIATEISNAENILNTEKYLVNAELLDREGNSISEALEGENGLLNLKIHVNEQFNSGKKIEMSIPNEINLQQRDSYKIRNDNGKEVGDVTVLNDKLKIRFNTEIPKDSILSISGISYSFAAVNQTKEVSIDFGNNIIKKVLVRHVGEGNFNWFPSPRLAPIEDVDYWTEHILISNYRVMASDDLLKDSPNYTGVNFTPGYKYPAYYFFGHNEQEQYLPKYFATCVDLFHTIGLSQNGSLQYSDMTNYIEADAVYKVNLYMQMAIMLATENGMIINEDGSKIPIEFTNDEQQAYMFAGQYLGWQQTLMYNKNPEHRINNVTTETLKPISPSGLEVDISKYIEDIMELFSLYENVDYLKNNNMLVELDQSKKILSIPKEQQVFSHYIDKEASKNLDLIDGLTNDDFENFDELTIKPNQKFGDKKVEIVIRKKTNTFWNEIFTNTGLRYENTDVQYKGLVGLLNSEIKTEIITLSMENETSATVTKAWEDKNNQDGKRPTSIQVQLYGNEKAVGEKVTLNEENQWQYTWTKLPEKESGKDIVYTVKEVDAPSGYEIAVNNEDQGNLRITNTYKPELVSIKGTKTWEDKENQEGKRPDKIVVNLLADGKEIDQKEVTEAANWRYEFTNLPKYRDGKEIVYTVTEDNIPEYTTEITGTDITNRYTPGETSATVTKAWEDKNNQDGKRPTSIQVQLYGNEKAVGEKVTLNEENQWQYTWTKLPEKEAGKDIVYTVKEVDAPSGYEIAVNNEDQGNLRITNTYKSELVNVKGTKTWEDKENQGGKRPDKIVVNLLADGKEIDQKEVTEAANWSYEFTNLLKYRDGKEIVYTVTEDNVPEYTTEITGTDITNRYTPGETSATVTKVWEDKNNQNRKRPTSIQVQLYGNEKAVGEKITLNEGNQWQYTWTKLPEKEAGKDIVYTVKEVDVPSGYRVKVNNENQGNIIITNIITPLDLIKPNKNRKPSSGTLLNTGEKVSITFAIFGCLLIIIALIMICIKRKKSED